MNCFHSFFLRHQAKKLYFQAIKLVKKQHPFLSGEDKLKIKGVLTRFENLIVSKNLTRKDLSSFKEFKQKHLDLKGKRKWTYFTLTTLGALAAALVIRQMWFELYKVPTGSMRPTIKELDHLTVSKLNFSLNVPFTPAHFYFNPELVTRSSICVFTSENMDVSDSDTRYFYVIPGKKLLVKRLLGKPGDLLYFYGGKIYGLSKEGADISDELSPLNTEFIDHIPFIQWLGEKEISFDKEPPTLYHMNAPFLQLDAHNKWTFAIPDELKSPSACFGNSLSNPWGIKNYATTRLLNSSIKTLLYPHDKTFSAKGLYLELKHHLQPGIYSPLSQTLPLSLETSLIPLDDTLGKKLFNNLYTARFIVDNGTLKRYGSSTPFSSKQLPHLHHIPDGTYEFYYGKAYQILWGGYAKELSPSHPIYRYSQTALETFFNLGIEFNTYYSPSKYEGWAPPRYSYFREGTLYVMGLPFLNAQDPAYQNFIEAEALKEKQTPRSEMFSDEGAPYCPDGSLDKDKIMKLGLKVPDKMYLVLGDNHAQSADSRVFGFVPEENLKGCPDIIFWPPGSRWGHLPQSTLELLTLPRAMVWSTAWILTLLWIRHKKKRDVLPQNLSLLDE